MCVRIPSNSESLIQWWKILQEKLQLQHRQQLPTLAKQPKKWKTTYQKESDNTGEAFQRRGENVANS